MNLGIWEVQVNPNPDGIQTWFAARCCSGYTSKDMHPRDFLWAPSMGPYPRSELWAPVLKVVLDNDNGVMIDFQGFPS